jgi:hypothetical protein
MTPSERLLLLQRLCDEIISRPLGFPLDRRGGILTPAIPAKIFHPDFTRKRHIRRNDGALPCKVLSFAHPPHGA